MHFQKGQTSLIDKNDGYLLLSDDSYDSSYGQTR